MLVNKKLDMTPYDMARKPSKQYPFLLPLIWGASFALTRQFGLRISKELRGIKPPYLIFSTHQGFSDYYIGPLSMFPRRCMYISDMEGFAGFGNWLYRGVGCIGKRRYVPEVFVVRNIRYALKNKQSVMVFPESRHSNVGTTAYIPKNLGQLCKMMKVPVVVIHANGSYLANPFWDEERTRKVPMKAEMKCLYTAEELAITKAEDIQLSIEKSLLYDEYRYQQENGILIKEKYRAEGIHKPLYQCHKCGAKYRMTSNLDKLVCESCKASWSLTEDGWLKDEATSEKIHIPDWYEWERTEATANEENFVRKFKVRIEALPNQYGFVDLGEGTLTLDKEEFCLKFESNDETKKSIIRGIAEDGQLHFPHNYRESVQTEYNYRGKGMCIVLSTLNCCFYLYCDQADFNPTELQFIGEYLFQNSK